MNVTEPRRSYAPILLEMLPLYPSFIETEPRIRDGWRESYYLAHGWYLRCHRGVEALLLLDGNGFAEEASPLRRSIIEHVLNLRWLAIEGDGVLPTIASGQAVSAQKRSDAAAIAKWASVDQVSAAQAVASAKAAAVNPSNDYLLNFISRVERYGDVHTIPGYLAECARTHPSYESAVCYVEIEPANRGLLLHKSRDEVWQTPFATAHLLEALVAVREVFDPKPWDDEIASLVQRFQETTDHVRAEDGLPPVDWKTGNLVDGPGGKEAARS